MQLPNEIDITRPAWFIPLGITCIAVGVLIGGFLYLTLEPYHLDGYHTFLVFTTLFLGAAAVGVTPHLVPMFFPEEE